MVVNVPRKGLTRDEPPDMVRVQLKPNDIRSYRRRDAEELRASGTYPGAFIVGEQPDDDEGAKAQRQAPNKARTTRSQPKSPDDGVPPAPPPETKAAEPTITSSTLPPSPETKAGGE